MIIEFTRTISKSEVKSTYLNLTDDRGHTYGSEFPPHRAKIRIIDGQGRRTNASKHHTNQIWGSVKNWFIDNEVEPGDLVKVTYNPEERDNGLPVIHMALLRQDHPLTSPPEVMQIQGRISEAPAEIPVSFEKQIEDFLERNVGLIEPGLTIYKDEDGYGRQYPTDVGVIDLLCQRPNGDFVVVELKRGKGSDAVVGQISRYMGWVKKHLAAGRNVFGIILAADADEEMQYAVVAHPNIRDLYFRIKLELTDEPPK